MNQSENDRAGFSGDKKLLAFAAVFLAIGLRNFRRRVLS